LLQLVALGDLSIEEMHRVEICQGGDLVESYIVDHGLIFIVVVVGHEGNRMGGVCGREVR
jgi:hypothetical protein